MSEEESKEVIEKTFRTEFSKEGSITRCELYYKGELIKVIEG